MKPDDEVLALARRLGLAEEKIQGPATIEREALRAAIEEEVARGSTLSGTPPERGNAAKPPSDPRFVVMASLGGGGMGDVFRAFDRKLERFTALKVLRATDLDASERLRREARAQAQVEHPGVCRIFDVSDDPAPGFIVMELIDGDTLDVAARTLDFDTKLALAIQIADAIAVAHTRMVLHRDLKPQNVLVTRATPRRAVVTDFGLARDLRDGEHAGIAGTPAFMAPEQARGEGKLTTATDVYGLGATFYALFAGRAPYEGPRALVVEAVLHGPPPPLALPDDLGAVIAHCMRADPAARYQSASDVAAELRRVQRREATRARPHGIVERASRRAWRAWPAMIVVLFVVAVVGVTTLQRRRSERRTNAAAELAAIAARAEAKLREAALLPLHDLTPERNEIEAQVKALDAIEPDDAALIPARTAARGRVLLAAGKRDAARDAIEAAHRAGDRSPELLVARARLLLEDYERRANDLVEMAPADRTRRLAKLDTELRQPALASIRRFTSDAVPGVAALKEALSHAPTEAWDVVVERNERECAKTARDPEPCRLAGDAAMREARRWTFEAQHEKARSWLTRAAAAYGKGLLIARSDPALHRGRCVASAHSAWVGTMQSGDYDTAAIVDAALPLCDEALKVDSTDPATLGGRALLAVIGEPADLKGRLEAVRQAETALASDPTAIDALLLASGAQVLLGDVSNTSTASIGPAPEFHLAIAHLRHAYALLPERADTPARLAMLLVRTMYREKSRPVLLEATRLCEASHAIWPDNIWYQDCRNETVSEELMALRQEGTPYRAKWEALVDEQERKARAHPDDQITDAQAILSQYALAFVLNDDRATDLPLVARALTAAKAHEVRFPGGLARIKLRERIELLEVIVKARDQLEDPRPALFRLLSNQHLDPEHATVDAEYVGQADDAALDWCEATRIRCDDWRSRGHRDITTFNRDNDDRHRLPGLIAPIALHLASMAMDEGNTPTKLLDEAISAIDVSGEDYVVRPRHELLSQRWQLRTDPSGAVAALRAFIASKSAILMGGQQRAKLAELIAEAQCLIAEQTRMAADREAARAAVAEYPQHAPTDRLHRLRLERLLQRALGAPAR